ncbi:ABC transporter permease [Sinomonas cellulolyticus]|jgi:NitT/TauT family transport system permease protein|uniref:ABC transporter permease n=1 Tax=Sinomonas cellulolyticus TaxID=2801916 RepID=A0ABS1K791_9MICC|nr:MULTISPECIES: ABC transporter permease [Sinomonas]MBL0707394.1 ABC transporter permease [Sinomonas cellulolyticus]GHG51033.1 ABC transporter permease [Sinomonas sp. KCTC 49339]
MTVADTNRPGLGPATGTPGSSSPGRRKSPQSRVRATLGMRLLQLGLAVVVLVAWELLVRAKVIDEFFFPLPSEIFQTVWLWISSGYVFPHLWITMQESLLAFIVGAAAGLALGFILARASFLERLFQPFLQMFNALPRVVLAPIFLLWFGLGIWSKVAFGFTLVFFIVFFNTLEGVKSVDRVLIDNVRMLGGNEKQLLRNVFIPSALTWIFSSLHISVGFAITGAVVGEYLGASGGVGYAIAQAQGVFDTKGVFAGMFILMIVVLIVDLVVNRIERHLLRWRPAQSA